MMMSRVYEIAQHEGMDKNVSIEDFLKFDEVLSSNYEKMKEIQEVHKIIAKPLTKLKKADIDFVLNYEIN